VESLRCLCGADVEGADEGGLFVAPRAHFDQAHPHRGVPHSGLRRASGGA